MINNIMKLIILLLVLISTTLSAEDYKFKYDDSYFHWTPVVDITTTPYWATVLINDLAYMDDLYSVQVGVKYKFDDTSYMVFKTEYATDYTPGSPTFHFIPQPTLIFEFRTSFEW